MTGVVAPTAGLAGDAGVPARRGLSRSRSLLVAFKTDHLLQNSFYIMLSTATMGLLGFLFWVLNARLFSPGQIGVATTLISATALICYVSLLGFNSSFVSVLPTSADRDEVITTGLVLVFLAAVVVASAYILVVPSFTPPLRFIRNSLPYGAAFVALTAFASVNLVTDSVFIAYRAAKYNFIVDGVINGFTKLALPLAFVGIGAFGMFAASGVAATVAVLFSLVFMVRRFAYRPQFFVPARVVRQMFSFSMANYIASLLNMVPILVLPLVVINGLGPADAGYYYVAFQIANLLNAVSYAVSMSLFAEGSYEGSDFGRLVRRSGRLLMVVVLPACALLAMTSRWLLLVFGSGYSRRAAVVLVILALSAPFVALNAWTSSLLRLTRQLPALIATNAIFVVVTCGLALLWMHRGLTWIGLAWLVGNLVSGSLAAGALIAGTGRGARQAMYGDESEH